MVSQNTGNSFLCTPNLIDENVTKYELLKDKTKVSQIFYRDLIQGDHVIRHCMNTWFKKYNIVTNLTEFTKHFKNIYLVTDVTKLRSFQFRLLHNKIFCNDVLVYWGKSITNLCNFCGECKQDIKHLLFDCKIIVKIWDYIFKNIPSELQNEIEISFENILFNKVHQNPQHICNLITLIVKQVIYRYKCQNERPSTGLIVNEIRLMYRIESYNAIKNQRIDKIRKKVEPGFPFKSSKSTINTCKNVN